MTSKVRKPSPSMKQVCVRYIRNLTDGLDYERSLIDLGEKPCTRTHSIAPTSVHNIHNIYNIRFPMFPAWSLIIIHLESM